MKIKTVLPWVCVAALAVGLVMFRMGNQGQTEELTKLREESQELQKLRAAAEEGKTAQASSENAELTQLRKEHEDLLRLRNEIRQLRDEKQALSNQVRSAQNQAQNAQAQVQAQAQIAASRVNPIPPPQPGTPLTPEQQAAAEAFRARYGLASGSNQAVALTPDQQKAQTCMANLRAIEAAKQQWAADKGRQVGGLVGPTDIAPYFPNSTVPACPSGGVYTINTIGHNPLCNIPGHVLEK